MKKLFSVILFFCSIFSFHAGETLNDKFFTFHFSNEFPLLHPQLIFESTTMQIVTATNEGLFTYDPYSALPVKALAENFSFSGKTWRFNLRKDAFFENGDPITAETIKQSWLNLLSPDADFAYASLLDCIQGAHDYRTGKNKDQNSVAIYVEDKQTLSVYLTEPTPHLASILCNPAFAAIHPSQLEYAINHMKTKTNVTAKNAFIPISSGPFKIAKYDEKQITFVKNEKYWDTKAVQVKGLILRMDLSEAEQAKSFNNGELHWTKNATLTDVVGTRIINYAPMFATSFFFFNVNDKNVANDKLRKALLFAIPYEKLRADFQLGAETLIFPLAGYPEVRGVSEQNLNQAKKLISELKLKSEEKTLTIKIYDYEFQKKLATILKEAWEKLGLTVNIKLIPTGAVLQQSLAINDYSVSSITWIADFADPVAMLELFRGNSTLNESGWADKHFDELLSKAGTETDISKRYKILSEAEAYLLDKGLLIPLAYSFSLNVVDTGEIGGWFPNALDVHPFKFIYFKTRELAPGFI